MTITEVGATEVETGQFAVPKGARKSRAVYKSLKRQILLGILTPDSPITEQSLAAEFDCSQGTVREALLSLQENGLVDRRGYQGTYVTRTTDEEAAVLVRVRLNLECAGMERAAARATGCDCERLRELATLYLTCRSQRDVFACTEVDRAFHMGIFQIADMPMLEPILKRTLIQLHRFVVSRHQGNILWDELKSDPHREIVEAMEQREADSAQRMLNDHIGLSLAKLAPEVHKAVFKDNGSGHLSI
ncbi:GntR family transcriptional regulator [Labrenzia sp. CE80]|uniref:GntR family transcriptional regulator n=1 Tax=Labrenzia sp. CE80 TaxID=1788986 RepID=UPI001389FE32|nr:GntR family transcriptional regulator [Labrenzia sp. CE80]